MPNLTNSSSPLYDKSKYKVIWVTMPTVTTESSVTVALADHDLAAADYTSENGAFGKVLSNTTTALVAKDPDHTISFSAAGVLTITEGASGFVTGDIIEVLIGRGTFQAPTATV